MSARFYDVKVSNNNFVTTIYLSFLIYKLKYKLGLSPMDKLLLNLFIDQKYDISHFVFMIVSSLAIAFLFQSHDYSKTIRLRKRKIILTSNVIFVIDCVITYFFSIFIYALLNLLSYQYLISSYYLDFIIFFIMIFLHILIYQNINLSARLVEGMTMFLSINLLYSSSKLISISLTTESSGFLYHFVNCFFYVFSLLGVIILLKNLPIRNINKEGRGYVIIIIITSIISTISTMALDPSVATTDESRTKFLIIFLGIETLILLLYGLFYWSIAEQNKSFALKTAVYKLQTENQMSELSKENYNQLTLMQEQMKKQYSEISELIKNKNIESLHKYFSDLYETSFAPLTFIDCGNSTISSILNIELAKAREVNITIKDSLLVPKELPFIDYDLCSLLTNIIDNAIEATVKLDVEEKVIDVDIHYRKPYLFCIISNPTNIKPDQLKKTIAASSKNQKELHGYGTKIINMIVKKYNGLVKYEIVDNKFQVSAMLMERKD